VTSPPAAAASRSWLAPTLRGYQRSWLGTDIVAGLAAGTVVVPQAMAYATIAGLPVQIGLYSCMLPMVVYALLGGSRSLSISTTSTIAVLVAATLSGMPVDTDHLLKDAFTLTFLVGVCLLGMRLFRLGGLVENISPATLTGIKTGVGLTVAVGQLPKLLGVPADPDASGFFDQLWAVVRRLGDVDGRTAVVSAGAIAILVVLRRVAPTIPAPLIAVAGGILVVALTDIEKHGLALISPVPSGLPTPVLPVVGDIGALLPGALAIAVMAFLESVLVARANRQRNEPPIDSNQELLAVGFAAMAGGLSQTLPPAGGFSQSAVNLRSGARSQVAGLTTAVLAVLVALLLSPVLDDLPQAILASMVVVATLGLVDLKAFVHYGRIDPAEMWVAIATAVLGLTAGLLLAVAVGVILTFVLVIRALNYPRVRPLYARAAGGWTINPPEHPGEQPADVLTLHLDGSLYTGNAQPTADAVMRLASGHTPALRAVVLEAAAVGTVTVPMLDTMHALGDDLAKDGVALVVASLPAASLEVALRSDWFSGFQAAGRVHRTVDEALAALSRDVQGPESPTPA
jgi:SulP family sulfate permease